jgi:hypothetical protein
LAGPYCRIKHLSNQSSVPENLNLRLFSLRPEHDYCPISAARSRREKRK